MKNKILPIAILLVLFSSCRTSESMENELGVNTPVSGDDISLITDGKLNTFYEKEGFSHTLVLENKSKSAIGEYSIYSATAMNDEFDPVAWKVYGSNDNSSWIEIDSQADISFWARFQERSFSLSSFSEYRYFKFDIQSKNGSVLRISEIKLRAQDMSREWINFRYPVISFINEAPETKGSEYYNFMIQNKEEYLKYHAREVAKLLYFKDSDPIRNIQYITYRLRDYDGVSGKSGSVPSVLIDYSTRHVEKSYSISLFKLDFETRGVLYHEMTHCYQYEPKNCGSYADGGTFWAFIEGLADAVRIHSGFIDMNNRKPGGWYTDGYQTTGFFMQWLTTKDPDALRKLNASARDLETWTFDAAIKYIFGQEATVLKMWQEYQIFLKEQ